MRTVARLGLAALVACKTTTPPPAAVVEVDAAPAPSPSVTASAAETTDAGHPVTLADLGGSTANVPPYANDAPAKPNGPKGDVAWSDLAATPPIGNAERVIAALRPRFRACYNMALQADPKLSGSSTYEVSVNINGEVLSAKHTASAPSFESVAACAERAVRSNVFDAPADVAKLTFKLTFTPPK